MTPEEWMTRHRGVRRGRLACVSAARPRGLAVWYEPAELHLAFAPNAPVPRLEGVRAHRSRPIIPADGAWIESVPDMLAHVAMCVPRLDALVVWESALHKGLVSHRMLQRIAWPGPASRELARAASPHSQSILETLVLHRLAEAGIRTRQQVALLGHRVDFLIGERFVLQTDGFEYHQAAQREEDLRHDARLLIEGCSVLRLGSGQVLRHWPESLALIQGAIAGGV